MNVSLVSPYRGAIFELSGVKMQPLGISYIGSALKASGHEVRIELLENQDTLPDFTGADIVGISCNTVQFNSGLKVAQAAKAHGKTVIMGGPHPTSSPEETLRSGFVDYAVCGEGEATAVELLEGLKTGKSFDPGKILGISWIDKRSGRIVHNPGRPFIQNLDELPFPIRDANWRYGKNGTAHSNGTVDYPLITTRGCPYGCKFCDVHLLAGRGFRPRSVENTVKEIEHILKNYNAERIIIVDDIINFNNERLVRLFEALINRGLPVVRWVMGRGDHLVKNPVTAEVMARAGVRQMFLGIENPSESILKAYRKGGRASSEVSLEAVKLLRQNGIETWGAFLLGEPSETMKDIERTIEFAKFINPGIAQFSILTPFPGTDLWKEVESKVTTRNWDKYDAMHSVFTTDHLDSKELEKALLKAYMGFYRQPKRIFHALFNKDHYGSPNLKSILEILKALKVVFTHQ
jgi:anaerobic magnesium-protoporphyrin IX monomethyl ester cyclase